LQVDGRRSSLLDFDDPNLPSLLAMPLLGFDDYDIEVGTALQLVFCTQTASGDVPTAPCHCTVAGVCAYETCDEIANAFKAHSVHC
jgi:hypothetical protein